MNVAPLTSIIESLGWTLLHFVWQAGVVAVMVWCLLRFARKTLPQVRYVAGCVALSLMATGAVSTFVWHLGGSEVRATGQPPTTRVNSAVPSLGGKGTVDNAHVDLETAAGDSLQVARDVPATAEPAADPEHGAATYVTDSVTLASRLRPWLPWIVGVWAAGVGFLSIRLFASWRVIRRMRAEGSEPEDKVWIERFARLRQRLGVSRPVRLLCSASATVPIVIGWLKPVVLVPAGLFTGLSSVQLEAILAHELTHIRRYDYLVNLLQNVLETLFFYHPAVWWVSRQIRKEREHCCDDRAAAACGGALDYARALTALEEQRRAPAALGMAASGGSLVERIRRLAGANQTDPHGRGWPAVAAIILLLGAAISLVAVSGISAGQQRDARPAPDGEIPVKASEKAQATNSKESDDPRPDKKKTPAKRITVRGKVVDDETGEPVAPLIIQAGKFDPADPTNVTWGFSEGRSGSRDGSFSTTVRWTEGWTARIIADGYVPQPVLTEPPPPDKDTIEVVIRLKKGRIVRGRVLDHNDRPVKGAAVFAIGPTGLNLAGGKAWMWLGREDDRNTGAHTDEFGRFELSAGQAKSLAVSSPGLDAWPSPVPEEGEALIRLPAPARIDVLYRIEGGDEESKIFYELLPHHTPGFEGLASSRTLPVKNGGRLELAAMPPGKYQFCREKMNRLGQFEIGAMLERQFLELKPGETRTIQHVRQKGARLRGRVTWPEGTELAGVVVSVKSEKTEKDPFGGREWQTTYDSRTTAKDGGFLTERIAPGRYLLVAEGYTPLTDEQRSFGAIGPAFRAETTVQVPESGEVTVPDLPLAPEKGSIRGAASGDSDKSRPAEVKLKEIIAGVERVLGSTESMKVRYHREMESDDAHPWPRNWVEFAFKGDKRYLDHTRPEADGKLFRSIAVYDGKVTREIFGNAGSNTNRGRVAPVEFDFYTMHLFMTVANPPGLKRNLETTEYWLPYALRRPGWRLLPNQERVDDAWCHVLQLHGTKRGHQKLWVDTNIGIAVRKREFYVDHEGKQLKDRWSASNFVKVAEGIWLPKGLRRESFDADTPEDQANYRVEIKVSELAVNNVTDALFDVDALDDMPRPIKASNSLEATGVFVTEHRSEGIDREILKRQFERMLEPINKMVGKPAPKLPSAGWIGERPELGGKPYLLHFWAAWSRPCKSDLPQLKRLAKSRQVIGIHPPGTPVDEIRERIGDEELTYPTLVAEETEQDTLAGYPVRLFPYCVIVGGNGRVVAHGPLGPDLLDKWPAASKSGKP